MNNTKSKIMTLTIVFLIFSLVSGGASAILLEGLAYDILYAIHKITSVLMTVFFVIGIRKQGKMD